MSAKGFHIAYRDRSSKDIKYFQNNDRCQPETCFMYDRELQGFPHPGYLAILLLYMALFTYLGVLKGIMGSSLIVFRVCTQVRVYSQNFKAAWT